MPRTPVSFLASMLAHAALIALAVWLSGERPEAPVAGAAAPERRVQLIELEPPVETPPPVRRAPQPPEEPAPEPPPERMPRPQVERGPDVPPDVLVADRAPEEAAAEEPPPASAPEVRNTPPAIEEPSELASAPVTMESEAERLFGPRRRGMTYGAGPIENRRWAELLTEDRLNDCRPRPMAATGEMGEIAGVVFRQGTRDPLPGAFLQILGTGYSTFADDDGRYRLVFDRGLVDECRTQYVQVSKDGFRPQRLILGLGAAPNNDIPMSRR